MADIGITKYRARVVKENALPSNPGNPATNPVDPVNPPASGGGTGVNQFIQLTDTPATYSGATLNYARVNVGETGLEFRTPAQVLTDIGGIGGTIASGQVAFGTGAGTIGGSNRLKYIESSRTLEFDSTSTIKTVTGNLFFDIANSGLFQCSFGGSVIADFTLNAKADRSSPLTFYLRSQDSGQPSRIWSFQDFSINTGAGSGGTRRLVIPSSGNVGIGDITPTNTLDVNGTTRIRTINNLGTTPTEVLVPSATGVISKRTLSEFAGDIGAVTITGTQTITGEKTFSNSLLIQEASAPILRLKTTNETQATINFRNIANEDEAGLQFDAGVGKFSLLTRTNNCDIEIAPHGTGSILLPNVPSGSGTALGVNASNELVTISSFSSYKLLDEDITPSAFTSTTFSTLLTGGILGTNSFDGSTDASYEGTIFIRSTSSGSYNFDLRLSIWSQNIDTAITIGAITGDIIHKITFKLIVQSGNFLITGLTQFTDSAFTYGYDINPSMITYTASGTSSFDIQAKVSGTGSPTLYLTSFVLKQIQ